MTGWPWPMDGVQRWFESLWNWVSTAAVNAVSAVSTWVNDAVKAIVKSLSDYSTWVRDQIHARVGDVSSWLDSWCKWVVNSLTSVVNNVSTWISNSATWVKDRVKEIVDGVSTWITNAVNSISNYVWDKIQWLKNQLSAALDYIKTLVTNIGTDIGTWIGNQLNNISTLISNAINASIGWVVDQLTAAYEASKKWFDDLLHGALSGVAEALGSGLKSLWNWFITGARSLAETIWNAALGFATWLADSVTNFFTDIINRVTGMLLPGSPPQNLEESLTGLAMNFQKSMMNDITKIYKSPAAEEAIISTVISTSGKAITLGAGGEVLGAAADSAHPTKQLQVKDIIKSIFGYFGIERLIKTPLNVPYEIALLRPYTQLIEAQFTTNIPGPGDLVRFAVREAWRPELQIGTPTFFIDYMKKMGFSDMWSRYFWAAHWIIPTYEQARESFWRGILSATEFADLRKYADLAPAYDKVWEGLQYDLPGRIDIRWLNEWGLITREQFITLLKATGMSPEWVEKIADAYDRNQLRDELNRLRTDLVSLFKEGFMSEADLRTELTKLGFRADVIDRTVEDAERDAELTEKKIYVSTYVEAFRKGKINENQLIGYLQELKVEQWRIRAIVDYEKARIKVAG